MRRSRVQLPAWSTLAHGITAPALLPAGGQRRLRAGVRRGGRRQQQAVGRASHGENKMSRREMLHGPAAAVGAMCAGSRTGAACSVAAGGPRDEGGGGEQLRPADAMQWGVRGSAHSSVLGVAEQQGVARQQHAHPAERHSGPAWVQFTAAHGKEGGRGGGSTCSRLAGALRPTEQRPATRRHLFHLRRHACR